MEQNRNISTADTFDIDSVFIMIVFCMYKENTQRVLGMKERCKRILK